MFKKEMFEKDFIFIKLSNNASIYIYIYPHNKNLLFLKRVYK